MTITVNELRAVVNKVLDHLMSQGVEEIKVDQDYYWDVDKQELYNPYEEPKKLELGQLSSDVETLKSVLQERQLPVGWHLVPLSAVLRYIGERNMP